MYDMLLVFERTNCVLSRGNDDDDRKGKKI